MSTISKCRSNGFLFTPRACCRKVRQFYCVCEPTWALYHLCGSSVLLPARAYNELRIWRYFRWIKLTPNALSILIHFWIWPHPLLNFFLSFSREVKKLNDYYFRLFQTASHLNMLISSPLLLSHSPGELYKNLLMIIIIWIWWWIFNAFWSIGKYLFFLGLDRCSFFVFSNLK